jgi:hypothetical protein
VETVRLKKKYPRQESHLSKHGEKFFGQQKAKRCGSNIRKENITWLAPYLKSASPDHPEITICVQRVMEPGILNLTTP